MFDQRVCMEFLEDLLRIVTTIMNEELTKAYTNDKVRIALQQMHLTKAPKPNGMSPNILPKVLAPYWKISYCCNPSKLEYW